MEYQILLLRLLAPTARAKPSEVFPPAGMSRPRRGEYTQLIGDLAKLCHFPKDFAFACVLVIVEKFIVSFCSSGEGNISEHGQSEAHDAKRFLQHRAMDRIGPGSALSFGFACLWLGHFAAAIAALYGGIVWLLPQKVAERSTIAGGAAFIEGNPVGERGLYRIGLQTGVAFLPGIQSVLWAVAFGVPGQE